MKEEVLNLISNLVKHPSAVEQLVGIGGVEFFSQLRPSMDPNLQALIDGILDGLFVLPSEMSLDYQALPHQVQPCSTVVNPVFSQDARVGYFQQGKSHLQETEVPPKQQSGSSDIGEEDDKLLVGSGKGDLKSQYSVKPQ
ncbi:hypothetical protein JD844_016492 [Phrynosoma platyrhinos]|uniref:Rotatin N-terminal domain-containing protein n=1 Tax=Phrynosoma platyrhinos TaxID=52577 RepID=A0ABQ7SKL6_PHRPL|nr:hypothetical protein JD844_016492 [Phrynosoma platyrhinos]